MRMLPRPRMLTTKKQRQIFCAIVSIAMTALFAGCTPPGRGALLDGERLLQQGNYSQAVEKLKEATSLLSSNAIVWNELGVAYQYCGRPVEAQKAYERALLLNRELAEARYNLGCLWLDQNRLESAKAEFTAYTLRRANSVDGFLKLGTAQLRSRDFSAAERNFSEALKLSGNNKEALNGEGVARLQRGRAPEAVQCFTAALKQQSDYAPAMLNLAITAHQHLKNRQMALERYREYAAFKPTPPNLGAVTLAIRQLEQELAPPAPHLVQANGTTQSSNLVTSSPETTQPKSSTIPATVAKTSPPPTARPEPFHKSDSAIVSTTKPPSTTALATRSSPVVSPSTSTTPPPISNTETVKLSPDPVFRAADDSPVRV